MFLVPSSSRAVDPYLQTLLLSVSLSRLGGKHRQEEILELELGMMGFGILIKVRKEKKCILLYQLVKMKLNLLGGRTARGF